MMQKTESSWIMLKMGPWNLSPTLCSTKPLRNIIFTISKLANCVENGTMEKFHFTSKNKTDSFPSIHFHHMHQCLRDTTFTLQAHHSHRERVALRAKSHEDKIKSGVKNRTSRERPDLPICLNRKKMVNKPSSSIWTWECNSHWWTTYMWTKGFPPTCSYPLEQPNASNFLLELGLRLDHKTWLKHDITNRQIPICDSTSWTTVKILSSSCLKFSWVLTLTFGPHSCVFAILRCSPLVHMVHKAVDVSQVCMVLKISADWS